MTKFLTNQPKNKKTKFCSPKLKISEKVFTKRDFVSRRLSLVTLLARENFPGLSEVIACIQTRKLGLCKYPHSICKFLFVNILPGKVRTGCRYCSIYTVDKYNNHKL